MKNNFVRKNRLKRHQKTFCKYLNNENLNISTIYEMFANSIDFLFSNYEI
jgi:hypothetical protein